VDRTWDGENIANKYLVNHEKMGRRAFNTHLRWEVMPKGRSAKYIYIYRNGKDVCTSFFHHLTNQADSGAYEGNFDNFLHDWAYNKIPFGGWIPHLKSWIQASEDPNNNILLLRYESLKSNLYENLRQIAIFLGCRYDEEYLNMIMPKISLDRMKEKRHLYEPQSVTWKENFEFIRKGCIGDYMNIFTDEHLKIFDEMVRRECAKENIVNIPQWLRELI
jgi:hypothetical protein